MSETADMRGGAEIHSGAEAGSGAGIRGEDEMRGEAEIHSEIETHGGTETLSEALGSQRRHVTILAASETGNSLEVAEQLLDTVAQFWSDIELVEAADYDTARLASEDILLMVTSTQGMGEPPYGAEQLHDYVMTCRDTPLDGVAFAVLGLGDSDYGDDFNRMARQFDKRYEQLGGRRLIEHGECDYDYEGTAAAWIDALLPVLRNELGVEGHGVEECSGEGHGIEGCSGELSSASGGEGWTQPQQSAADVAAAMPSASSPALPPSMPPAEAPQTAPALDTRSSLVRSVTIPSARAESSACATAGSMPSPGFAQPPKASAAASHAETNEYSAVLTSRTLLTALGSDEQGSYKQGSDKQVFAIRLELADAGTDYQPGDMVAVRYVNSDEIMERLFSCAFPGQNARPQDTASVADVYETLRTSRDVTKNNLALMTRYAQIGGNTRLMELLTDEQQARDYGRTHPVTAIFEDYPAAFAPEQLLDVFTARNTRLYSISNAPSAGGRAIELTITAVRYRACGREYRGACTSYLVDAPIGTRISLSLVPNSRFHMPQNDATPMIMIALGSAIAPFRAFLQEREAVRKRAAAEPEPQPEPQESRIGDWLIFADRSPDEDFLYRDELEQWRDCGVLSRLDTVWSRHDGEFRRGEHIQDALPRLGDDLLQWLDSGAHMYLCGHGHAVLQSIEDALTRSLAAAHGRKHAVPGVVNASGFFGQAMRDLDLQWAEDYVNRLRADGRLHV
jgi:sulfite reductase (NADPH) flavoprotein alpha-component